MMQDGQISSLCTYNGPLQSEYLMEDMIPLKQNLEHISEIYTCCGIALQPIKTGGSMKRLPLHGYVDKNTSVV
jgi:hypothetical protein